MYVRRRNDRGEVTPYKRILFATCGGIRRNNVAFNTNGVNKNATFGAFNDETEIQWERFSTLQNR